jgi:hypothetical protein
MDPEGKILKFIEDNKIEFNKQINAKSSKNLLILILIMNMLFILVIYNSISRYGFMGKPVLPIFMFIFNLGAFKTYSDHKKQT